MAGSVVAFPAKRHICDGFSSSAPEKSASLQSFAIPFHLQIFP
jgi:hypothetical protein